MFEPTRRGTANSDQCPPAAQKEGAKGCQGPGPGHGGSGVPAYESCKLLGASQEPGDQIVVEWP